MDSISKSEKVFREHPVLLFLNHNKQNGVHHRSISLSLLSMNEHPSSLFSRCHYLFQLLFATEQGYDETLTTEAISTRTKSKVAPTIKIGVCCGFYPS